MLVGFCEIWPIQWGTSFFNPFPTLYGYRSFKPLYFSGTPTFLLRKQQFIMAKPNLFIGKSACFLVFPEKQHIFHGRNHHVSQVSWWNGMLFTVKPPWVHGNTQHQISAQVCTSDHKPISSTWTFMAAPVFQIPTSPATKVGLGGILMRILPFERSFQWDFTDLWCDFMGI